MYSCVVEYICIAFSKQNFLNQYHIDSGHSHVHMMQGCF